MTIWAIGDLATPKVIPSNWDNPFHGRCPTPPVHGLIYTVRDVFVGPNDQTLNLLFEEIVLPHRTSDGFEIAFLADFFEKVVKPDIGELRKLLIDKPRKLLVKEPM